MCSQRDPVKQRGESIQNMELYTAVLLGLLIGVSVGLVQEPFDITDPSFQDELNKRFAEAGIDNNDLRTPRARHLDFVSYNARAQQMGHDYYSKKAAIMKSRRENGATELQECDNEVPVCDTQSRFRTFDGSCNNLDNPTWGMSFIPMRRFLPPQYADGVSLPRIDGVDGFPLPSARLISTTVHQTDADIPKLEKITHMLMQWGQFLDHDLTLTPVQTGMEGNALTCCQEDVPEDLKDTLVTSWRQGCFSIPIPPEDPHFAARSCMDFDRSVQIDNVQCTGVPAEQMNQLTAFVDASNVYGSDESGANILRTFTNGLMRTSADDLLPFNNRSVEVGTDRRFQAGEGRANEQTGLTSMHTIYLREHNRIARALLKFNPNWDDERIYQEARRILGAVMQKITYNDFLPLILNPQARADFDLISPTQGFNNVYDKNVDPSIRNSFATAAYRFGHSLLRTLFSRLLPDYTTKQEDRLRDLFGNTKPVIDTKGQAVNELLRGEVVDRSSKVDRFITPELTNFLFATVNSSLDLASLNNQRGRDHGLPGYTEWRTWCGLPDVTRFGRGPGGLVDHDQDANDQLMKVYRDPRDIDLFSGGLSETPVPGGLVGPTFTCILANQYSLLKRGDRFWFETDDPVTGFTAAQLQEIRKASLSRNICDNTDTFDIQKDAFTVPEQTQNVVEDCGNLPSMDLSKWTESAPNKWLHN